MIGVLLIVTTSLVLQLGVETAPPGFREASDRALDLTIEGKDRDVIAMWEQWVAKYPKFREGRMRLAAAHESLARSIRSGKTPGAAGDVSRHYKIAVSHLSRAIEEAGGAAPFDWMRSLIDMHHTVLGAGPQVEHERLVREAVKRYPAEPYAHGYVMVTLADQGQAIDAAAAAARAALPKTADARADVAGFLAAHIQQFGRLMPESGVKVLVAAASSFVDEALTINPKHADALRTKSRIDQLRK